MKALVSFFFLLLISFPANAQPPANPDYLFINHLASRHQHREALFVLQNQSPALGSDTVNFLLGFNYHFLKRPDTAAYFFSKVPVSSAFQPGSGFLRSLNMFYSFQKNPCSALEGLNSDSLEKYFQLHNMAKAADFLINRNYRAFDSLSAKFSYDNFNYAEEQRRLVDIKNELMGLKRKSPAVAGLLSAVVPGLGKFYAGRKGAGLSAFFMNMVLAGMAYENYYRSGYKSPQFIFFGTIFGFFYAGNIVGSVYSVKQHTRSMNGKLNNEIIATIHIPVNRLFVK